jgi:CRISPR-associated protein Cas1
LKNPSFARREYRPAPDYVNSSLNLAYAFLCSELTICLAAQRFDLEIGFLHSIRYGRNSLPLDLMEEFRSSFADAWLLGLFNKNMLKESHFYGKERGYYLNSEGFAKFIALYHEHLEDGNWKPKFRAQAQSLKKAVMTGEPYEPYRCE